MKNMLLKLIIEGKRDDATVDYIFCFDLFTNSYVKIFHCVANFPYLGRFDDGYLNALERQMVFFAKNNRERRNVKESSLLLEMDIAFLKEVEKTHMYD